MNSANIKDITTTEAWLLSLQYEVEKGCTGPSRSSQMLELAGKIRIVENFNPEEFVAAVLLSGLPQSPSMHAQIRAHGERYLSENPEVMDAVHTEEDLKAFIQVRGLEKFSYDILELSPFDLRASDRIVNAVMESLQNEEHTVGESGLLSALRMAMRGAKRMAVINSIIVKVHQ